MKISSLRTILSIDTTQKRCSISIIQRHQVLYKKDSSVDYEQAEILHKTVKDALCATDLAFSDLDAIAIVAGPGSFTGIRISLSYIAGLQAVTNIPVFCLSSLLVQAYSIALEKVKILLKTDNTKNIKSYIIKNKIKSGYNEFFCQDFILDMNFSLQNFDFSLLTQDLCSIVPEVLSEAKYQEKLTLLTESSILPQLSAEYLELDRDSNTLLDQGLYAGLILYSISNVTQDSRYASLLDIPVDTSTQAQDRWDVAAVENCVIIRSISLDTLINGAIEPIYIKSPSVSVSDAMPLSRLKTL